MTIHDEVAVVAYELFEARGRIPVQDFDDWLYAEQIVLARHAGQDLEEPEEENGPEETAEVKKTKTSEESDAEENQEASFD